MNSLMQDKMPFGLGEGLVGLIDALSAIRELTESDREKVTRKQ